MAKKKYLTAKTYKKINEAKKEKVVFEAKEKKQTTTAKSPSISRIIPEFLKKLSLFQCVMLAVSTCLLVVLGVLLYFLGLATTQYFTRISQRQTIVAQQQYWQGIISAHPDYRDAYIMLSVLDYKLGDKQQAQRDISKALELDPNDTEARAFAQKITREGN